MNALTLCIYIDDSFCPLCQNHETVPTPPKKKKMERRKKKKEHQATVDCIFEEKLRLIRNIYTFVCGCIKMKR